MKKTKRLCVRLTVSEFRGLERSKPKELTWKQYILTALTREERMKIKWIDGR